MNYDESFFAGEIAKHLNTNHTKLDARPEDAINLIEKTLPWSHKSSIIKFLSKIINFIIL